MTVIDTLIRNATLIDGSGAPPFVADVALVEGRIQAIGHLPDLEARQVIDAQHKILSPGFIDVHTHDDLALLKQPAMLPKICQGVTTVIVGNCGISAAGVRLRGEPPDPMNLLGEAADFKYPTFNDYAAAIEAACPAVNVAALVGHTALRANHMQRFDRAATPQELEAMRDDLKAALQQGALGLSTGLAYRNALHAPTSEVDFLAETLQEAGAIYVSHIRSEDDEIIEAIDEALDIGRDAGVPVIISHLKCAGRGNWGRSAAIIDKIETARRRHPVGCDCYPYAASSTTIDPRIVDESFRIQITWSTPHPEMAGKDLKDIAGLWGLSQVDAAQRLEPGGAIYHEMDEADVSRILAYPHTMIGSDGLPNDPRPHPRLWGTFARVLGHYSRDQGLFPLEEAVRKMTGLPAERFGLHDRGRLTVGAWADLVLFDAQGIRDCATFEQPTLQPQGIESVWVNGVLSYSQGHTTEARNGQFIRR
ncbi:D-aminoacylase [Pseudomonas sp. 14P_8.1_Bac3]|uniref:N-acyl-D-amino-acid deacylase family protein n=1 Tax=Pseudomonas sp. 14P_8.1_Bac3 TaxID=2971621 RepID=UPI0021C5DA13|nr:D-aminoacylase [Pseudomonas sp. 14P_8.1_Bac3]MCU1758579.1 D-aminoacylase [Pseudomonas sp. 14P_8.1_Bac3]